MSATKRFRFEYDGRTIIGPVQGCGGFVPSLRRLLLEKERAAEGRELGIYEPAPGCVKVCPDYSAFGNGEPVIVPIASLAGEAKS